MPLRQRRAWLRFGESKTTITPPLSAPRRCVCPACGYLQDWPKDDIGNGIGIGREAVDRYFRLPLWLQTPCCDHTLWAYNANHRAYLEAYITATLREQTPTTHPNRYRTLVSRLPVWMKSQQNRADVLKGLARLQRLLE